MMCLYCDDNRIEASCPRCGKGYCDSCEDKLALKAENTKLRDRCDRLRLALEGMKKAEGVHTHGSEDLTDYKRSIFEAINKALEETK